MSYLKFYDETGDSLQLTRIEDREGECALAFTVNGETVYAEREDLVAIYQTVQAVLLS